MTLGDRIKQLRLRAGMTQEELGERIGVRKAAIYKYENGLIVNLKQTTIADLADALDTTPAYLMGWEEPESEPAIPRGFEAVPRMIKRPVVGAIACGLPMLAEENIEGYLDVPEDLRCDFVLRCHGDSMVDVGITDGDLVYIRAQPMVENGEIAAVRIDDDATLKRVYRSDTHITLIAENRLYPPQTYSLSNTADIQIEGKAIAFTHWF